MTTEIVSAALGAFIAWGIGAVISFFQKRKRLITYLTVAITTHLQELKANGKWLERFLSDTVKVNAKIDGAPLFTRDALSDLTDMREMFLSHLTQKELTQVVKCINALQETEVLFEGLCCSARELQAKQEPLTQKQADRLHTRGRRIQSLLRIIPEEVKSLEELPSDYSERVGPEVLVVTTDIPEPPAITTNLESRDTERGNESRGSGGRNG